KSKGSLPKEYGERIVVSVHKMEHGYTDLDFSEFFDINARGMRIANKLIIDFTEDLMMRNPKSIGAFTKRETTKEILPKDPIAQP
ncbi:MAG: hypothetical protein KGH98_04355, partial [Candidatus Micrarchaeota archaeon]|nr:hypothetical protein [Candidatus Micrarchaeota archaeon]